MAEPARAWRLIGALGVVLAFSSTTVAASELTGPQERGKEIYFSGSSPSGDPIRAFFGADGLELPGEVATCGSCHGHDGKGRPESGVVPSNITWQHLTRSYGHLHADGLEHPPFDEQSLRAYMRTGVYPGGRKGDPSMPLYEISDRDLEDLLAYMRLVGELLEPGLSPTAIRIATHLPAEGTLGEIGRVIRDVLEAYFRDVNEAGGIYGRRLELVVHEIPEAQASVPEAALAWLGESQPFALVSPFTPRMDEQVHSAASDKGIPLIGPFTLYSVRSFVHNRNVFYLYSGLAEQLEALLQFADAELGLSEPRVAVLYPDENALSDVLDAVQTSGEKRGWPALRREPYSVAGVRHAPSSRLPHLAARPRALGAGGCLEAAGGKRSGGFPSPDGGLRLLCGGPAGGRPTACGTGAGAAGTHRGAGEALPVRDRADPAAHLQCESADRRPRSLHPRARGAEGGAPSGGGRVDGPALRSDPRGAVMLL
jgi:hypothetical protein